MTSRDFLKEHKVFETDTESSYFLNSLGQAAIWYFGDTSPFDRVVDAAFKENPDAHLVLLDNYRILDVNQIEEGKI